MTVTDHKKEPCPCRLISSSKCDVCQKKENQYIERISREDYIFEELIQLLFEDLSDPRKKIGQENYQCPYCDFTSAFFHIIDLHTLLSPVCREQNIASPCYPILLKEELYWSYQNKNPSFTDITGCETGYGILIPFPQYKIAKTAFNRIQNEFGFRNITIRKLTYDEQKQWDNLQYLV